MALEGPVGGPQGRHDVVAPHILRTGGDGAHQPESGLHQGRAAQEDVPRSVRLLPAYWRSAVAVRVLAPRAAPRGALPDPVPPLGRAGPVASSQLVNVHRGRSISPGDAGGSRGSISWRYHPAGQAWMVRVRASLAAARCAGLDVDGRVGLIQRTGFLRDAVCPLVPSEAAMRGDPLQVDLAVSGGQLPQCTPDPDAQRGALGRRTFSECC